MEIIRRAVWGARFEAGYGPRRVGNLDRFMHHSVTKHLPEDATIAQECEQMRAVEAIGEQRFGVGMSYTLGFFPSGRVYEGAGIDRISPHSGGWRNTTGAGLVMIGNFDIHPFGSLIHRSVVEVLRDGVHRGWWTSPTITAGHREFKQTACPGRYAFDAIPSINAAGLRDVPPSRDDTRVPVTWTPAVKPELINQRLALMGIKTAGGPGDYDREAVRLYQAGQVYPTLLADGLWGPLTEAHFNWVIELQRRLVGVGARLNLDGFYGSLTAASVRNYQRARGLRVDGEAGPVTCGTLGMQAPPALIGG